MEHLEKYLSTKRVTDEFIGHLRSRDKRVVSLFAEHVDWYIQGDKKVPWLGRLQRREQIEDFFEILWVNTIPVSASIERIFIEEGAACIVGEFTVNMETSGKQLTSYFSIFLTINSQGKIEKYRLLEDSYAVSQAYPLCSITERAI